MIELSTKDLHPLVKKRHAIYATWWGSLMRADSSRSGIGFACFAFILCIAAASTLNLALLWIAIISLSGLLSGSLFEYLAHRFAFHKLWRFKLFKSLEDIHMPHHYELDDGINAGPLSYISAYSALFLIVYFVFQDLSITASFMSGFALWFALYEYCHEADHVDLTSPQKPMPTGYVGFMVNHHRIHHDKSWKVNFGITSPLWDFVCGTYQKHKY